MKTRTTVAVVTLSLLLICGGLGCVAMSKLITPATIDSRAKQYTQDAGIAGPNDYDGWWDNLAGAERLEWDIDMAHGSIQLQLQQQMETDTATYAFLRDVVRANVEQAQATEEFLFSEKGLMSTGLSMLGAGGLMGFVGLMRKRPQDWTAEEVQSSIARAKAESEVVVASKDQQLVELVTKIQKFLDSQKTGEWEETTVATALKEVLGKKQSPELRETVAKVKATIV